MLADRLEQHPDLPLPYQGSDSAMSISLWGNDPGPRMAEIRRMLGVPMHRNDPGSGSGYDEKYLDLTGRLGGPEGLRITIGTLRDTVCERVVTGTETVVEQVPDPNYVAAAPTVEVTRVVEQVRWDCHPLLADAPGGAS